MICPALGAGGPQFESERPDQSTRQALPCPSPKFRPGSKSRVESLHEIASTLLKRGFQKALRKISYLRLRSRSGNASHRVEVGTNSVSIEPENRYRRSNTLATTRKGTLLAVAAKPMNWSDAWSHRSAGCAVDHARSRRSDSQAAVFPDSRLPWIRANCRTSGCNINLWNPAHHL
jgi:hypothetical protein